MSDQASDQPKSPGFRLADLRFNPIAVELANGSTIQLGYLSGADEQFLEKLLTQDMPPREFVVAFLHHQLVESNQPQAEVDGWSDADLKRAARAFAEAKPSGFGSSIPDDADVYEAFRSAARAYLDELYTSIRETLSSFTASYEDKIRPIFGVSDSLASSIGASLAFDPPNYGIGLAAVEAAQASLGRVALSGLGSVGYPDPAEAFDSIAKTMANSVTLPTLALIDDLSNSAANAVRGIYEDVERSIASLTQPLDFGTLIPALPDLTESFRRLGKARDEAAALQDAGLGYTVALWEMQFLVDLLEIAPQDRAVAAFSELPIMTQGQEFEDELQHLFTSTSILAKRWPAVREGIEDHQRGRYFASVSVLLPQIQGLANDILTLMEVLIPVKPSSYEKNSDGTQEGELKRLDSKSALAKKQAVDDEDLARFVASSLVPERIGILHGIDAAYGRSNRSAHLVMVLLMLASAVTQLRADSQTPSQSSTTSPSVRVLSSLAEEDQPENAVDAILHRFPEIERVGRAVYTDGGLRMFLSTPLTRFGGRSGIDLIGEGQSDQVLAALASDYEGHG